MYLTQVKVNQNEPNISRFDKHHLLNDKLWINHISQEVNTHGFHGHQISNVLKNLNKKNCHCYNR